MAATRREYSDPDAIVRDPASERVLLDIAIAAYTLNGARQRIGVRRAFLRSESVARDPRDVGDAPGVEDQAGFFGFGEGREVEEGRERGALPACGDVARADVRYGDAARALGDHRRITDLQRGVRVRVVRQRLAVRSDRVHLGQGGTRLLRDRRRGPPWDE